MAYNQPPSGDGEKHLNDSRPILLTGISASCLQTISVIFNVRETDRRHLVLITVDHVVPFHCEIPAYFIYTLPKEVLSYTRALTPLHHSVVIFCLIKDSRVSFSIAEVSINHKLYRACICQVIVQVLFE